MGRFDLRPAALGLVLWIGWLTLKSIVEVTVKNESSNVWTVTFTKWTAQVFDDYNWDAGKSVYVPGWGEINDTDALKVERLAGQVVLD